MTVRPDSPASGRNRQPILDILKVEFRHCGSILEIGSGTGQHAVFFAEAMPWLNWQTSDLADNHAGIRSWLADAGLPNVQAPILLDVLQPGDAVGAYDGIFSANTAHIMSLPAVRCMFDVAGRLLKDAGVFCLYGPFNQNGQFSSESNRRFDASLRSQNAEMGVRDLEELDEFAGRARLGRVKLHAMPANNFMAVWQKYETGEQE